MVKIIGCSNIDEKLCAASGRISTQKGTSLEIFERSQDVDKNKNLISKVTASGHTSTVEHIYFNLAFDNVSVVVEQFMIEFRLASFTVKSRRYVDFADSGYYIPEFQNDENKTEYVNHMNYLFDLYSRLVADNVPMEDARFVLPYCFFSNFYCSLNGRELINVLKAMLFGRGSKMLEIRLIGQSLLTQAKELAPGVFADFENRFGKYNDECDFSEFIDFDSSKSMAVGEVEILSYTNQAEQIIAQSELIGKYGLSSSKAKQVSVEHSKEITEKLTKTSRSRALEAVQYTIRFSGISLATLTHFSRHRMQTLVLPNLNDTDRTRCIIPQSIQNSKLFDEYKAAFLKTDELFQTLKGRGEDASVTTYCLLAGNLLDFVSCMNARQLLLFMKLRSCNRAQWEINSCAIKLLAQLRKISPALFNNYGPSCFVTGSCPEGRLCCGKMKEIKEKFKADLS